MEENGEGASPYGDPRRPGQLNSLSVFCSLLVVPATELAHRKRKRKRERALGPDNSNIQLEVRRAAGRLCFCWGFFFSLPFLQKGKKRREKRKGGGGRQYTDITRGRRTENKIKSRAAIYGLGKQTGVFGKKRPRPDCT